MLAKDRPEHDWEEQHPGGGSVTGGTSTGRYVVPGYDPAAHGFATVPQHGASCRYSPWLEQHDWLEKDEVTWSDAERAVYSCLVAVIEKCGVTDRVKELLGTDLGLQLSYQGPFSIEAPIEPAPRTVLGDMLRELLAQDKDHLERDVPFSLSKYMLVLRIAALPRSLRELTRERKAAEYRRVESIEKGGQRRDEHDDVGVAALQELQIPSRGATTELIRDVVERMAARRREDSADIQAILDALPGEPFDLESEALPQRPGMTLGDLLSTFEQLAEAHPEQALEAVEKCRQITERYRPSEGVELTPEQEQFRERFQAMVPLVESGKIDATTLDGLMADLILAYRESGGTILNDLSAEYVIPPSVAREYLGIKRSMLARYSKEGRIGKMIDGRYLYSWSELVAFKAEDRPVGRPPQKNLD